MSSSQSLHDNEAWGRDEQRQHPQQPSQTTAGTGGPTPQEGNGPGTSGPSEICVTDTSGVREQVGELLDLRGLRIASDNDDEGTSNAGTDTSGGISLNDFLGRFRVVQSGSESRAKYEYIKDLSDRGAFLFERFEQSDAIEDIDQTIECWGLATSLVSRSDYGKPTLLSNLGCAYQARFERLGEQSDLAKSIECAAEAVSLTPEGHVDKPGYLNNLGNSYQSRFNCLGELSDLNKAIDCEAEAVLMTPDNDTDKPGTLNNLGNSYLTRFDRLGELIDLNKAIECGLRAASLTLGDHPDKPGVLDSLGNSYKTRFERLGEVADLNKAIEYGAEATSLTPDGHADKPRCLSNLGHSYLTRFERLGEVVDLNKAIECGIEAVSLTPDGHGAKPGYLTNLGMSYRALFDRLGELTYLEKAIECAVEAVSLTPKGHPAKPGWLNNLGGSYRIQFDRLGDPVDLNKAIECGVEAISLTPDDHPDKPSWLNNLGMFYRGGGLADLATEAAAYAIGINNLGLALEWLEAGRSIVWAQIAKLRTPFETLSAKDPDLATRLNDISYQLESAGSRHSVLSLLETHETDLNMQAGNHIQLALEWDTLLEKARSIPGFESFLRPHTDSQLLKAAKSHPIAVINVHESRCDALVLQPNSNVISHVPLKDLSAISVANARQQLASQVRQRKVGRLNGIGPLESSLEHLWSNVLRPILDFLGYTSKRPIPELPRLTWCTTGLLSFLPLHAAGGYDGFQPNAMDLVISSYTPTLSALLARHPDSSSVSCGILAVSQEHTPGLERLPGTKEELAVIAKHAHKDCYLQLENDKATVKQVLDAMDQFSWVHMACHGSQDTTDPTQSAFHLHDGKLTLAEVTKKSFTNKGLAFLSACQTATGDKKLPEEAIHLAAGMLMAGFPNVIGTMWSISDEDGPRVADKVYASLLEDGKMDHTKAARALHEAVAELREMVGERSFERWAPFIHIGY